MSLGIFSRRRELGVQSFIVKVVNNNCPELKAMIEGPRLERRMNLTVVVLVIPVEAKQPLFEQAFTAVTKEFSTTGVSIVLDEPREMDEAIIGFRWEGEMTFVRGTVKHLAAMGGGFQQLGVKLTEIIPPSKYPELKSMSF